MQNKLNLAGAAALMVLALVAVFIGQPSAAKKAAHWQPELDAILQSRDAHIDPGELGSLVYDRKVELVMLDLRGDRDYNLFHLLDVQQITLDGLNDAFVRELPEKALVVLMGNGEKQAEEGWRLLRAQGAKNTYILAGGVNSWLDVFLPEPDGDLAAVIQPGGDDPDTLRHTFESALGSAHPTAHPPKELVEKRQFIKKVEIIQPGPKVTGGCG